MKGKLKMKKLTVFLITAAFLASMLTACSNDNGGSQGEADGSGTTSAADTSEAGGGETSADEGSDAEEGATEKILQQIKDAYGENYLPNAPIDSEILESIYGISPDMYVEYVGESPMISVYVDTVLIVKAASGKQGDVKSALEAYRTSQIEQSMMYPMNVAKVNASKVETEGDYVAFLMVGQIDEREDATDDDRAAFAEEQVKIAVDVFHNYFKS